MTHFEYLILMFHWFGCQMYRQLREQENEYKFIVQALVAMAED